MYSSFKNVKLKKNIKQIIVQVTIDWKYYSRNILNGFSKLILSFVLLMIVLLTRSIAMDRICTFKTIMCIVECYYSVLMNIMKVGYTV